MTDKDPSSPADKRISAYREAAVALRLGQFPVTVPLDGADDVARLGEAIHELAETVERKYRKMSEVVKITERVNAGVILDDVLDYAYNSFREIIPYDRIGFSLPEDNGRILRARWARSEAPTLRLTGGYSAPMEGAAFSTCSKPDARASSTTSSSI